MKFQRDFVKMCLPFYGLICHPNSENIPNAWKQKYVITLFAHLWNVIGNIKSHIEHFTLVKWVDASIGGTGRVINYKKCDCIYNQTQCHAASTHSYTERLLKRIDITNIRDEKFSEINHNATKHVELFVFSTNFCSWFIFKIESVHVIKTWKIIKRNTIPIEIWTLFFIYSFSISNQKKKNRID